MQLFALTSTLFLRYTHREWTSECIKIIKCVQIIKHHAHVECGTWMKYSIMVLVNRSSLQSTKRIKLFIDFRILLGEFCERDKINLQLHWNPMAFLRWFEHFLRKARSLNVNVYCLPNTYRIQNHLAWPVFIFQIHTEALNDLIFNNSKSNIYER